MNVTGKLKTWWHEYHAFRSSLQLLFTGNRAEKESVRGRLFEKKFDRDRPFINALKKKPFTIDEHGVYKRLTLHGTHWYWPRKANMDSLWVVLAEALSPGHPHYYDSGRTTINAGDRVLDIGACEGAFALHAARKGADVVAVEPSYTMIEAMQRAAADSEITNITLVAGLLGPADCELGFVENEDAPEASLVTDYDKSATHRKCWTLDTFVKTYFPEGIDYIKCDAEGADYSILASGLESLKKYKPKVAVAAYHSQTDFRKIQALLETIGYSVHGQGVHYSPVIHGCFPVLLKAC